MSELAAAPTPATTPAAEQVKINDPFSGLAIPEKKAELKAEPKAEPKADTEAPKRLADEPEFKEGEKTSDKPVKPTLKRVDPIAQQRTRIEELNRLHDAQKAEATKWREKAEKLEKQGGGDVSAFTIKQQEAEKQIAELRGKLASKDYAQHPDYIKNYEEPFKNAAGYAKKIVDSLEVTLPDGTVRPANWDTDFGPLYGLSRAAARKQAQEMFGMDAPSVMAQYDEIHKLQENKDKALNDWQSGADEREQKERADNLRNLEESTKAFQSATKDMTEANAELFQDNPDDADELSLRQKSTSLVDAAYFNRDKIPPKELLVLDAAIRLRAINYPVAERRLKAALSELAEYKERVEGKEASKAGKTKRTATAEATPAEPKPWNQELREALSV